MPTVTAAIIKNRIFFGLKFINIEFGKALVNIGYKFASLKSACYVLSNVNYRPNEYAVVTNANSTLSSAGFMD